VETMVAGAIEPQEGASRTRRVQQQTDLPNLWQGKS
jgi:hypothetical protein